MRRERWWLLKEGRGLGEDLRRKKIWVLPDNGNSKTHRPEQGKGPGAIWAVRRKWVTLVR